MMRKKRVIKIVANLLVAAGLVFLFLGARDYFGSWFGQFRAAREFKHAFQHWRPSPQKPSPERPSEQPSTPKPEELPPPQPGETLAKLVIPRLDTELYVVEGDDPADLRLGPGHLIGSAMPGSPGNCIIAGHRDTHFRILKDIREGDEILLETPGREYIYKVKRTNIISPKNTKPLEPTTDPELNLITCYPFYYIGSAPKRFVVQAELAGSSSPSS